MTPEPGCDLTPHVRGHRGNRPAHAYHAQIRRPPVDAAPREA